MARRRNISKATRRVLALLLENPQSWRHGYDITKATGLKSGSLYPILMRLSDQGWLESKWEASERAGRPPRHLYRLTYTGFELARQQANDPSLSPVPSS